MAWSAREAIDEVDAATQGLLDHTRSMASEEAIATLERCRDRIELVILGLKTEQL